MLLEGGDVGQSRLEAWVVSCGRVCESQWAEGVETIIRCWDSCASASGVVTSDRDVVGGEVGWLGRLVRLGVAHKER